MDELQGKVAVITGAGSGMARAAAAVFVREGARVVAADISGQQKDTAAELGSAVVPVEVDVADEASVEAMFAAAVDAFGRVDAALNVAGLGLRKPLAETTVEEFDRMTDVNLKGVMLCTKHAILTMLPTGGGAILNWSSAGGLNASKRVTTSAYSATKAGVIAITKAAAVEYGDQGIRANAILPGFVTTPMSGTARSAADGVASHLATGSALGRPGEPEEIGELASFLSSDRARFITGAVISIDGGVACMMPV